MSLEPRVTVQFTCMTQPMDCGVVFLKTISLQSRFDFRLLHGNTSASERLFCSCLYFCQSSSIFFNWSCSVTAMIINNF